MIACLSVFASLFMLGTARHVVLNEWGCVQGVCGLIWGPFRRKQPRRKYTLADVEALCRTRASWSMVCLLSSDGAFRWKAGFPRCDSPRPKRCNEDSTFGPVAAGFGYKRKFREQRLSKSICAGAASQRDRASDTEFQGKPDLNRVVGILWPGQKKTNTIHQLTQLSNIRAV